MTTPSIGYLLWDVTRIVRKRYESASSSTCLTLAQAKALSHIACRQGVKQVDLAEVLDIKPMTLVRVIDSLVEEGFVERRPDPTDRRAHLIYLLPAADEQLKKVKSVANGIWAEALGGLSEQEIEQFVKTLNHIHSNLSLENKPKS
ncbi:MarR family winged helix-turn-helix transcriptional regulator [Vibrio diazotrophicus]|uniref:MarR family winged helix-turn-helix transcriptional regulator n=1 Tax=Vibrio diazotrophicus TaxID=685 RepID=UPI0005AA6FE0|nr:MarR family winged helix-turn-helix transcriptional regulator [Vibrio diazotrophicus]